MSIYKAYEIRGDSTTELNADLYRNWGLALGLKLTPHSKFVVGGDIRASTPAFMTALIDGLCQAGLDVVDVGQLPTPMIFYARHRLSADGCAVVTASHHPANINGLKWMIGEQPPSPDDVRTLRSDVEQSPPLVCDRVRTESRTLDVTFDYVANLQETWVDSMGAQLHIVVDLMQGSLAGKARRYLHAIFPQCLVSTINDTPDPSFSAGPPDCSQPSALHELCDAVHRERAHLGIAFDGDGDCFALVDNQGVILSTDETAWILLDTFEGSLNKEQFVYDIKMSDRVPQRAKYFGALPLAEQSEPGAIHAKMCGSKAIFGVNSRGRFFFRSMEGGDDGLFAACCLIAHLAQGDKSLSQLRQECPIMFVTPDLCLNIPVDTQSGVLEKIRQAWSAFPQQTINGLRIDTPTGWILTCDSAADSRMTFRFESLDWTALDRLVRDFCDSIAETGHELWQTYLTAMGTNENG